VFVSRPRSLLLLGLPALVGAGLAVWWVRSAGSDSLLRGLATASPDFVLLALTATAGWLFARFIRWQFLLRRVGVRLPIRTTLGTYVAGLPGTATPAYVGEAIRGLFIKRRFGVPMRVSLAVLVLERLYDVAALALVTAAAGWVTGGAARALQVGGVFLAIAVAGFLVLWPVGSRVGIRPDAMARLRAPGTVGPALALSLLAWGAAAMLVAIAARALGVSLGVADGMRIFGASTLIGAVTLLPAGVGATGSVAILELGRLGLDTATAVLIVSLVRLTSTGAALSVGAAFLVRELRDAARGATRPAEGTAHFDAIAEQYNAQWSPHVWDLLLGRKLGFIAEALPAPAAAGVGLDLGCGLGLQTSEMRKRGYRVIGLDPSVGLLAVGQRRLGPSPVLAASALELPLADQSVDFVYTIGVLHHLAGREAQRDALREIARVLKPGGTLLVHESNPRNPLFRFYMGYLFPILKSIDEGTEWWIDPRSWEGTDALRLEGVRYFTFLPDFTPRLLMKAAVALERLLERGPTRTYSAHYMAVLRRPLALLLAAASLSLCIAGRTGAQASQAVARVSLSPDSLSLPVSRQEPLSALAWDATGAVVRGIDYRWSSSAPAVATITPAGLLTAVAPGMARITVTAGGQSAASAITVTPRTGGRITRAVISPPAATVAVGGTVRLSGAGYDAQGRVSTSEWYLWNTDNPLVAAVTADGRVTGLAPGTARITMSAAGQVAGATVTVTGTPPVNVVTVDPAVTFQTMAGWQGGGQNGWLECDPRAFRVYKDQLHDRLVNELGIERVTIALRSGAENTRDYHADFASGAITAQAYRDSWSTPVNDNDDPFVTDSSRFHWDFVDGFMDNAVLPLRQRMQARGERLQLVLTFVDFQRRNAGPREFLHMKQPDEYAEFVTMAFKHLQQKYGFVPDAFELVLEPEHTPYTATDIGRSLVAVVKRLREHGFAPQVLAPSTTSLWNASVYYDGMLQVPGTTGLLGEFAYHRYVAVSHAAIAAVGQRWLRDGVSTSMLEHIGSNFGELYEDLVVGNASSWMQYSNAFCGRRDNPDNKGVYYQINQTDPGRPRINIGNQTKLYRQVFAYVRRGAVRIAAATGNATDLLPVAFRNANGKLVVVVWARRGGSFSVRGLPAGTYGLNFGTTGPQWNVNRADQVIESGGEVRASVPAGAVLTVYGR
jgi:SAM-dependent methyltransferase/uncharacterized membrane protein YbhN (UPF0104 family)